MDTSENKSLLKERQLFIMSAAKTCFSRSGFHGASMADISRESGLGAGQLYRYFHSKELLVNETIKSIIQHWCKFLKNSFSKHMSIEDIIDANSDFWKGWSSRDRCLLLEVYSEASRNKFLRDMLMQEEQSLIAELELLFQKVMPASSSQQRTNRIHFLLMLVDGVACRTFGDKNVDQQELTRLNGILTRHLLS